MVMKMSYQSQEKISGVILSGGHSNRMKADKAFLIIDGVPIIEIIISTLRSIFKEIIIISNLPDKYLYLNAKVFEDLISEKGPLGGIYTALKVSNNFYNFIVACDMPFINEYLIDYMIKNIHNYDIVILEQNGKLEPLFAIYSKNCLPYIEKELSEGSLKVTNFFKNMDVKIIKEREIPKFDSTGLSLTNINTPEDYRRVQNERV